MDNQALFEDHLQDTSGKGGIVRFLPINSVLGRLPMAWAGDEETIPFSYHSGCRNGAHSYKLYKPTTPTSSELIQADSCLMYFVNSWALGCQGWSIQRPLKCNEVQHVPFVVTHYYTLYYIILLTMLYILTLSF